MNAPIDLDGDAHAALDALFDEMLDLEADARACWLDALSLRDPPSADALRQLLAASVARSPLDAAPWSRTQPSSDQEPSSVAAGTMIGAWRIVALAGSGGMGTVYRAERADGAFTRAAAIKLLNRDRAGLAAQFANERELLARLDHPHIARLLDGGVDSDGTPWLAMRWIDGEDLPEWLATHRIGLAERVAMFADVVRAVAYAHQHLVVHRDIKPDNVRVDGSGRAILVDFGIARLLEPQAGKAPTLAMFTPEYAAPEQLVGSAVTTLTDVHALGVLFYEMLAGKHPFPAARTSLAAAVQAICEQVPLAPSAVVAANLPYARRELQGDLDAIVLRCLAKEPHARYASAQALLEDVERHRQREPVLAHAPSAWYRASRLLQRHALPFVLAAAVLVALIAGLAGTAWQAGIARSERDSARLEAQRQHALREHLMLIFREGSAGAGNLTAKQMLDASAQRLDVLYGNDPALRRSVLLALGELYFTMSDWVAARAVLERFFEYANDDTPAEDRALAGMQLALTLLRLGETDAAEATFAATPSLAQASASAAVAAQRLAVQSALLRARGRLDEAIVIQRAEVTMRSERIDETPMALGIAQSNLGVALLQANRLHESRSALLDALETWRAAGLEQNSNAITTLGNLANIEVLLGELSNADKHYAQARAYAEAAHVESASSAALMANHARLMALLGRQQEALPMFERSL
ncbi:MAG: serine/threonine-protein kinase, partial [Dokdonella sp.]